MKLRPCAFMNCKGDDDIDAKRSRPSIGKTRDGPREERTRAFVWDPISGLHQGQQPKRLHSKAEYMAAPERFAELSDFSLAPRAPSIHGPSRYFAVLLNLVAIGGIADIGCDWDWMPRSRMTQGGHCPAFYVAARSESQLYQNICLSRYDAVSSAAGGVAR